MIDRKTTPEDLRRLLLVRLANYRAILAMRPEADRWYFEARINEVLADLALLPPAPASTVIPGDVADPSAA